MSGSVMNEVCSMSMLKHKQRTLNPGTQAVSRFDLGSVIAVHGTQATVPQHAGPNYELKPLQTGLNEQQNPVNLAHPVNPVAWPRNAD